MSDVIQEVRHAARSLWRQPTFAAVAVLTLALGIAANTGIFSVVNAVLLAPLPYPAADRLMLLWSHFPEVGRTSVSPANFRDWRAQNDVFEGLAAFSSLPVSLSEEGTPERLMAASVSTNYFQVLGRSPLLGTTFQARTDADGPRQEVVLSHGLWVRRFGGDPGVIGRSVRLDGRSYEVLGVMPPDFGLPAIVPQGVASQSPELWVPAPIKDIPQLEMGTAQDLSERRGTSFLRVLGRLKPGVTPERAASVMSTLAARLERDHPDENAHSGIALVPLREQVVGDSQPVLWVLLCAVGLVLAIACANVANLFLVRAAARSQELAVRTALGAGRGRLVRQLLLESLLLSVVAGGLGLLLAMWGLDGLLHIVPPDLLRLGEVRMDGRVLAFTSGVSLMTGLLFGVMPALQASSPELSLVLRRGGNGRATEARSRSRSALVVAEVALAVVLLISAGLLMRSLWRLQSVDPGFQVDSMLTWKLSLPVDKYPSARQAEFFEQVRQQVAALPGVMSVGAVSDLPFGGAGIREGLEIDGRPVATPADMPSVGFQSITPGYLTTLGIPLRQGRDVASSDTSETQPVVLVNEAAVRRFWAGANPVGQRIRVGGETTPWLTVVGVVADVRYDGLGNASRPEVYVPGLQRTFFFMAFAARTRGDAWGLVSGVRAAVAELDKGLAVGEVRTMAQRVEEATSRPRFVSLLVGMFAGMSLLLAAVGLFGVMAYMARQRTREMGIRMALGARPADVRRLVVGHGMRLALLGVAVGLVGAWASTRVLSSLLFGVSTTDPLVFGGLALVVTGVSLLATWIPALRATRVDPLVAMRAD
ncbi:ABC transporter permease [Myxococcaceae bacterium JPH2]|nr:ABC transporter permease [Myxococcaceae bacterium JPH2]